MKWQSKGRRYSLTWGSLGDVHVWKCRIHWVLLLLSTSFTIYLGGTAFWGGNHRLFWERILKGPKWNIIVKESSCERSLFLKIIHTVEIDVTCLPIFFKGCFFPLTLIRFIQTSVSLVFFMWKFLQKSWSQTSPPGYFLPFTFTSEKPHLFSMLASIPLHFRLQNVPRTHLIFNSALCCLVTTCVSFSMCHILNQRHTFFFSLLLTISL